MCSHAYRCHTTQTKPHKDKKGNRILVIWIRTCISNWDLRICACNHNVTVASYFFEETALTANIVAVRNHSKQLPSWKYLQIHFLSDCESLECQICRRRLLCCCRFCWIASQIDRSSDVPTTHLKPPRKLESDYELFHPNANWLMFCLITASNLSLIPDH